MAAQIPNFRINAQQVFLTYPKCELKPEELLNELNAVRAVKEYVIGREQHQDGTHHLHAYIFFVNKLNSTNERVLDVLGYHPNVQSARNKKAVISYVKKGGDYISSESMEGSTLVMKRSWGDILTTCKSGPEFLDAVKAEYPRDYCLNYKRLKEMADHEWPEPIHLYQPTNLQFNPTEEMMDWSTQNLTNLDGKVCFSARLRSPQGDPWSPLNPPASSRFPLTRALLLHR